MTLTDEECDRLSRTLIQKRYRGIISHPGVDVSVKRSTELQTIPVPDTGIGMEVNGSNLALSEWTLIISKGGLGCRLVRTMVGVVQRFRRDPMRALALLLRSTAELLLMTTLGVYAMYMVDLSDDSAFQRASSRVLPDAWGAYGVAIAYTSLVVMGPLLSLFASRSAMNAVSATLGQLDSKCILDAQAVQHHERGVDKRVGGEDEPSVAVAPAPTSTSASASVSASVSPIAPASVSVSPAVSADADAESAIEMSRLQAAAQREVAGIILDGVDRLRAFQLILSVLMGAVALILMTTVSRGAGVSLGVVFSVVGRNALEQLVESQRAVVSAGLDVVQYNLLQVHDRIEASAAAEVLLSRNASSSTSSQDARRLATLRRILDSFVNSLTERLF